MSISLHSSTIDTLAGSTIDELAGSVLTDSGSGSESGNGSGSESGGGSGSSGTAEAITVSEEPAITVPSYKYYRKVVYDTRVDLSSTTSYGYPYTFLRIFINGDQHLSDHAQLNGFDIFFVDLLGNYMPCELVYYANGTGEWWLRPGGTSGVHIPEIARLDGHYNESYHPAPGMSAYGNDGYYSWNAGWTTYFYDDPGNQQIHFYILYGDRTDSNHQEVTTDPTRRIWYPNNLGTVAHSSYLHVYTNNSRYRPFELPSNNPEDRPINSVLYAGHSNGYTSINTNGGSLSTVGNACCITPWEDSDPDSTVSASSIPIYTYSNGQLTTGGIATSLVFAVSVQESSITRIDNYAVYGLLEYGHMIATLTETYGGWMLTVGKSYSYETTDTHGNTAIYVDYGTHYSTSIPENGCALCCIRFYSEAVDNGGGNYITRPKVNVATMIGTLNSEYLPIFNGSQDYYPSFDYRDLYTDGIIIHSLSFKPQGENHYAGFGITGSNAALLEVRTDLPLLDPYAYSGLESEFSDPISRNEWSMRTFWNMLFNNENHRTISTAYSIGGSASTPHLSFIHIQPRTYQGLGGGCN